MTLVAYISPTNNEVNFSQLLEDPMKFAGVDQGTQLTFFVRMDDAFLGSIDMAIKKAKAAKFFDCRVSEMAVKS